MHRGKLKLLQTPTFSKENMIDPNPVKEDKADFSSRFVTILMRQWDGLSLKDLKAIKSRLSLRRAEVRTRIAELRELYNQGHPSPVRHTRLRRTEASLTLRLELLKSLMESHLEESREKCIARLEAVITDRNKTIAALTDSGDFRSALQDKLTEKNNHIAKLAKSDNFFVRVTLELGLTVGSEALLAAIESTRQKYETNDRAISSIEWILSHFD